MTYARGWLRFFIISLVLVLVCAAVALADVKLPALISDNMVMQQKMKVPIWGWAEPGEKVSVKGSWQWFGSSTKAGEDGKWMVKVGTPKAGGPYEITINGKNRITIKNILIGEVWLASGQSNMEMPVGDIGGWKWGVLNYEQEIAAANYPNVRLFTVEMKVAEQPQSDCVGSWQLCSPQTIPPFSAVAYFFGRELHRELNVPVGLIHASKGGTYAEAWTSEEILEADPDYKPFLQRYEQAVANYPQAMKVYERKLAEWEHIAAKVRAEGKEEPRKPYKPYGPGHYNGPSVLYNGMISPLIPYDVAGVIWYQGEANADRAYLYRKLFPTLIQSWRYEWGQGDFPFLFVQLANYREVNPEPVESSWAELREAQLLTLTAPNTGMAVAIDIGQVKGHPKNKQDVGKRLALWALARMYGKNIVYSGPIYKSMKVEDNKIILHFKHIGGGLVACGGEPLKGFAVAGADRKFVWADAKIEGDTVVVYSDKVAEPVAVRYAWADNPVCNLYNKESLPASSFRTDDWPGITLHKR